jgi:hypothetical protein
MVSGGHLKFYGVTACPDCGAEYVRHSSQTLRCWSCGPIHRGERQAATGAVVNAARAAKHREAMDLLKAAGCADCGGPGDLFHHVDPATKLFNVGNGWGYTAEKLAAEIAKCVVLCGSCHKIRHAKLREVST